MRRSCCLLYQLATIEDTCGNFQTSVAISSDSARNWQVLRRGREITWIRKDSIQRRDNRELPCISVSSKTLISIPQGSQKFKTGSLSRLTGACKAQTVAPCYSQSSGTGHPQSGVRENCRSLILIVRSSGCSSLSWAFRFRKKAKRGGPC